MGRPNARSICFIFPPCIKSNTLKKSTNNSVALWKGRMQSFIFHSHINYFFNQARKTLSSSSCHATSMDIPDPLSLSLPIVHCFQEVFKFTSCIGTELLYIGSSWLSCLCSAMWRGPQEYITHELVPTSPAVSRMFGSSNFDSFHDGGHTVAAL